MTTPHFEIQNIIFPGRRRHPLFFPQIEAIQIPCHGGVSVQAAGGKLYRAVIAMSYKSCRMPVLMFLNKNSHEIRPLAGYCWGVSGIGFLNPRNGNTNHFPGIENCIHDIWDGNMNGKFRSRFMGYSTKISSNIYCQVTVEVSLALDTVRLPLIADRRSVIVPGVPFIFKRKIRKQLNRAHMKYT